VGAHLKVVLKISSLKHTFDVELVTGKRLVLGRGKHLENRLNDEKVSSTHCFFTLMNDYLKLEDGDSKNGTYLNGIRIENAEIFIGDEIKIGDTLVTLNEKRMDNRSIDNLTFPGPKKERIDYELRADFTGVRIQNQLYNHAHPEHHFNTPSQAKEIALRKKAQTRIILSRQEIKYRHREQSNAARVIDTLLTFFIFLIPIYYVNAAANSDGIAFLGLTAETVLKHRMNLIGAGEFLLTGMFFILNLKLMTFSLGEKIMGIEKRYMDQKK
jgi:pSer/pThr/pTyr-binding forkhead associated (FHA) protein